MFRLAASALSTLAKLIPIKPQLLPIVMGGMMSDERRLDLRRRKRSH